jgi:antitoxin HicB
MMKKAIEKPLDYYDNLPYNIVLESWDDGDGVYWVARVIELPYCIIDGNTPEEALEEIKGVKREWIESNLKRGLKIPEPNTRDYSGQIRLRISPVLHRVLSEKANIEGISLNQYMNTLLAQGAGYQMREVPEAPYHARERKKATSTKKSDTRIK